jgi:hypothetical protein
VIGEPGPGKEQVFVKLPPGTHSDPRMDVDYVSIIFPDGRVVVTFIWGLVSNVNDLFGRR